MLEKDEYEVVHHGGLKYILCKRLDMLPDIEKELMQSTILAYKCTAEKENALKWLEMFQALTKITFNIDSSISDLTHVVFKARARCHHMIPERRDRPRKKPSERNSGCETRLTITAIQSSKRIRSKLPTRGYALRVKCNGKPHNHVTGSAEVLKYRNVSDSTKTILLELFDKHHSPSNALEVLKLYLLEEHGDNYPTVAADRYFLPDLAYATRLYYKTYRARYGNLSRKEVRKLREMALGQSAGSQEQVETVDAAHTLLLEPAHNTLDGEDVYIDSFGESEELPGGWFIPEVMYGETACTDTSHEQTVAVGTDGASAVTTGNVIMCVTGVAAAAAASTPRPDGASAAEEAAERFRQWAARVSEQIAADASGQSRDAAAALMRNWERLPAAETPSGSRQPASDARRLVTVSAVPGGTVSTAGKRHETVPAWQSATPRSRSLCVLRTADDWEDSTKEEG